VRFPTNPAQQIDPALPPSSPSSPKPVRNALFAFILALVGAIALAYGLERFDRRLRNPEELEEAYASPLLAVLPHSDDPGRLADGAAALSRDFREPFRTLRTNIELAAVDVPPRTILVSSAMPGEGKSTVVRNLSLAFHEAGKRVAVVDLDLRHPALQKLFGVRIGPGVTDVLRRDKTLDEVMLPIGTGLPELDDLLDFNGSEHRKPNGSNGHGVGTIHPAGLVLLLGGATPANPPAVLASNRLVQILDELRDRFDIVLIDSAPVLAVTDTVPLLRYADATLFVGRLGVTTRDTAKRLADFVARVPDLNMLGVVANDLSRLEAGTYGYGYGYGYDPAAKKPRRGRGRRQAEAEAEAPKQLA
jgi:non-specific protein-tyrosine kinase